MKVLGLHGHGTSGAIFRSQTAAFRSKLDPRITFDFVDAPFSIPPSLGIEVFFRGPYYTFWKSPELSAIREAHAWLLDLIEEQGPYDAVMCFSQGCALISSFLLWHQAETPNAPLPFKSAIFICGGIPLPVVEDCGVNITPEAFEMNMRTGQSLHAKAGALAQKAKALGTIQRGVGLWDDVGDLMHDATGDVEESDVFGLDFTRIPSDLRIKIPTVHIYGAKDPRYPSSLQLVHFCEKELRRTYDHLGGHDIPRKSVVSEQMAGLVEWVLSESKTL